MSRCWNESLAKAPISERVKLVAFLIQLHPHFPRWPGIFCLLLEADSVHRKLSSFNMGDNS